MRQVISLFLWLCVIQVSSWTSFRSAYRLLPSSSSSRDTHTAEQRQSKRSLFSSGFKLYHNHHHEDLSLGQVFRMEDLLQRYDVPDPKPIIAGVFILSNAEGEAQFVDSSTNVLETLYEKLRQKPVSEDGQETKTEFFYHCLSPADEDSSEEADDRDAIAIDTIRIQSFLTATEASLEVYKNEVIRQCQPKYRVETISDLPPSTTPEDATGSSSAATTEDITSPFDSTTTTAVTSKPLPPSSAASEFLPIDDSNEILELTFANVDRVLDKVRPYLVADGGNVAVVEVNAQDRIIKLTLQGACGSCPSSTTTMKMGIERVLKENFADIRDIIALSPEEASCLTVDKVTQSLEKILPAIKGLGGSLEVSKVEEDTGKVFVTFQGPERLKKGVQLVLLDTPNVKEVVFL